MRSEKNRDFHWFSLISMDFHWFSIDFSLIFSKCSKILDFFRPHFKSSQLFCESLWENMSYILCRCKIVMRIDCAYLEGMKINANHINRQFCESHTKKNWILDELHKNIGYTWWSIQICTKLHFFPRAFGAQSQSLCNHRNLLILPNREAESQCVLTCWPWRLMSYIITIEILILTVKQKKVIY